MPGTIPPKPAERAVGSASKRFYSEREIALILAVSVKTVQGWRFRRGGPPWVKFAGSVRYSIAELEQWIALCGAECRQ